MTAAEPEHAGDEEELDVFQPRRPPLPNRGSVGLLSRPHHRGGRTITVRALTSHARPRIRSRIRREPLRRLAAQAGSTGRVGLKSLESIGVWWRDQSAPWTLAASAVGTVVVLLAFAVVRDSSLTGADQDNAAGVADRSGSIPAMPGSSPEPSPSPAPVMANAGSMRSSFFRIPASVIRHQPSGRSAAHHDDNAAKPPRTSNGGGSKSPESESQYGSGSVARGSQLLRWSMRSVNYPDRYWRVRSGAVFLDSLGTSSAAATRDDASFTVVKGLADSSCYSFIADDGRYLRHRDFRLVLSSPDGSELFREDATFCPRPGAYDGTVSFESYNYPGRFLRHRDFELWLDPSDGTSLYAADSSFRVTSALY